MITFLEGDIVEKQPMRIVMNVSGVGYELAIPLGSYDRLPAVGGRCRILTVDHVREDSHNLFGFMTEEERRMFGLLLGTNGIGPKLALSALSGLSVRELKASIAGGDIKRLSSISGIGKKIAERIVVELRDKLGAGESLEAVAGAAEKTPEDLRTRDAVLALIALGYKQEEARRMVAAVGVGGARLPTDQIIKKALASPSGPGA